MLKGIDEKRFSQILDSAYSEIKKLRDYDEKLIIPGFFGVSHEGYIVTFPRGGSDITTNISNIRRACCASTKFISISLGFLKLSLTASVVISLKTTRFSLES
ncbi:hypothetical protein BBX41_01215 [Staphylococcus aureus]|nr:hypothetical protein BBX41_01215 [Staphylococcus aureus]